MNRPANIGEEVFWEAHKIPKADWTEMYFDLYRQTHREDKTDQEIMLDAKKRRATLKSARIAYNNQ